MELSKKELGMKMPGPSVSTVSFYYGEAPLDLLHSRVKCILVSNPWLGFALVRREEIVYLEPREQDDDAHSKHLTIVHGGDGEFWTCSAGNAVAKYSSFCVPKGFQCLETSDLLFKVVVLVEPRRFVLVTSVSHVIADGHTYYEIHGMLAPGAPIRNLCRDLVHVEEAEARALGETHMNMMASPTFGAGLANNRARAEEYPAQMYFEVDSAAVEAIKSESKSDEVSFVSSNDVITGLFLSASAPDLGLMAVNLRSRLEGLGGEQAGNYENAVSYIAEDFSPIRIRQSISSGRLCRVSSRNLPVDQLQDGRISLITSWHTFASNHVVAFDNCELVMHLPVTGGLPFGWLDFAIIFMRKSGALGIMCRGIGACKSVEALRESDLGRILGQEIAIPDYG